jgi:hypothetical protein
MYGGKTAPGSTKCHLWHTISSEEHESKMRKMMERSHLGLGFGGERRRGRRQAAGRFALYAADRGILLALLLVGASSMVATATTTPCTAARVVVISSMVCSSEECSCGSEFMRRRHFVLVEGRGREVRRGGGDGEDEEQREVAPSVLYVKKGRVWRWLWRVRGKGRPQGEKREKGLAWAWHKMMGGHILDPLAKERCVG